MFVCLLECIKHPCVGVIQCNSRHEIKVHVSVFSGEIKIANKVCKLRFRVIALITLCQELWSRCLVYLLNIVLFCSQIPYTTDCAYAFTEDITCNIWCGCLHSTVAVLQYIVCVLGKALYKYSAWNDEFLFLDNCTWQLILPTFRLDALVHLKANEAKAWGPQFIATSSLAGVRHC